MLQDATFVMARVRKGMEHSCFYPEQWADMTIFADLDDRWQEASVKMDLLQSIDDAVVNWMQHEWCRRGQKLQEDDFLDWLQTPQPTPLITSVPVDM